MKKLFGEQRGETLVEALCAILIITVCFLFLTNASVVAGKLNKMNADKDSSFHRAPYDDFETATVIVKDASNETVCSLTVKLYESELKADRTMYVYRYYRLKE